MPWKISKRNNKYCVEKFDESGKKEAVPGGCHATYAEANEHMRALYANVPDAKKSISGAMLAFYPEAEIAQELYQATINAQITPQPVGDMHMTLVYLGETLSEPQINALTIALRDFADQEQGLDAVINGVGRFRNSDPNAVYANVDSGGLPMFRQELCDLVQRCGIEWSDEHGFTPHITLAYVPNDVPMKEIVFKPVFAHFTSVVLQVGGNQTAFQLAGYPRESLMEAKEKDRPTDPDLYAYVPDKNESSTWELPIQDADHVSRAISELSSHPQHGQGAKIPAEHRAGAISKISARIGKLNISDDKKQHLRDELNALHGKKEDAPPPEDGDAVPLHGPIPGEDGKFGPLSSPGVRPARMSAVPRSGKKKPPKRATSKGYIAPAPMGLMNNRKTGWFIGSKGEDGLRHMFLVTSNSYKDREQETITTKALSSYVEQAWRVEDKCLPDNTLLFWHKGDPIGDIVWCKMEGPFLLEVAKERRDHTINLNDPGERPYKARVKAVWDALEKAENKVRLGASHGYEYPPSAKDKSHTYHAIRKFETSVLPLREAANPYTFSGVINMNKRDQFLNKLLGIPDAAENILNFRKGIRSVERDLKNRGIQHKTIKVKGILETLQSTVHDFLSEITDEVDPEMEEDVLQRIVESLATGATDGMGEGEEDMNEAYDEMDEPEEVKEEDTTNEYLSDDELPANHNVKPDGAQQMGGKAFNRFVDRLVASQESLVTQNERITKAIENLTPITELPKELKTLSNRLSDVEKRLGGRPRQASIDKETINENKELEQKVIDQSARVDSFWGAKVKEG